MVKAREELARGDVRQASEKGWGANGQLGQLYRDGGITSDSRDYFTSIDAVGNDLRVNPIPNCGKGQPMQAKRMSNGGPTMRGIARLTGPG